MCVYILILLSISSSILSYLVYLLGFHLVLGTYSVPLASSIISRVTSAGFGRRGKSSWHAE